MPVRIWYYSNVRRCKPENTLVFTKKGLKRIQDIEVGEFVKTSTGYSQVKDNFYQGEQKLIKINTQIGDSLCTPEHRMAVLISPTQYVWKHAKDLTTKDALVFNTEIIPGMETSLPGYENELNKRTKDIVIPNLDTDLAWFFGYFHGNGCVYINKKKYKHQFSISAPSKSPSVISRLELQIARFGVDVHLRVQGGCHRMRVNNKNLCKYFSQFKTSWTDITVPPFILEGKRTLRGAYLAGLYDADGNVAQVTKNGEQRLNVVLTSSSPSFLTELQSIYASLGIPVRHHFVRVARKVTQKDTYELLIVGRYAKRKWKKSIGIYSTNYRPYEYSKHTRYDEDYHYPRSWFNNVGYTPSGTLIKSPVLSVDEYIDRFSKEPVLFPVKVLNVEHTTDVVKTFDLSVDDSHEYYCGEGLLNHNSAEICLGDVDDKDFLNLKNYKINPERSEIGWMSNNSVVLQAAKDYKDFTYIPDMATRIRDNGEPGMINLYNIQKFGRYGKVLPDQATLVNPCFSGETLIATADGRGCVRIDQLAKEGKDVPVYSIDEVSGEVSIQWGRHPRVTGKDKKLLRVHFGYYHKGEYLDVTPNHKFLLNDGRTVEAKDLKKGDSLPQFKKCKNGKDDYMVVYSNGKRKVEHRMIKEFFEPEAFYKTYEEGVYNGCCKTHNVVVHHKDENKLNNHPENLDITTASEHNRIHNVEYIGKGNPMYGKKHAEATKKLIGEKCRLRCEDPEYREMLSKAQTPEMREAASKRMKVNRAKWQTTYYDNVITENSGLRIVRESDTVLRVIRTCENDKCAQDFSVPWRHRERAFCSHSCANTKKESIEARKKGQAKIFEGKAKDNFYKQSLIYQDLLDNKSPVTKKDFEQACKSQGVSCRFNANSSNPWIASGWRDFKQMVVDYNHRVSSVEELPGDHTVYNITVDNNHTLAAVTKMKDDKSSLCGVYFFNCGEIPLENYELCNLSETFPPRCQNADRFFEALKFATFYASTVSLLPTHRPETNAVIARNRRIGVSISGVAQWASGEVPKDWGPMNYTKMTRYLRAAHRLVRAENQRLAREAGVPESIRVTTVKPSGSISLLAGVTPGVHYPVSRYAIRRMRIGKDSPLVPALVEAKIPHEDDTYSDNTLVFEFAIDHGNVRPCEEVSPWEQFSLVAMMQRCYADNCVSATIYFDKDKDGPDVEKMLAMFIPTLKSVSMLPHSGHGYAQAPYEPIDKETYEKRKAAYNKPNFGKVKDNVPIGSKFCTGDKCML